MVMVPTGALWVGGAVGWGWWVVVGQWWRGWGEY